MEPRQRGVMDEVTNLPDQGHGQGQPIPKPRPKPRGKHFPPPPRPVIRTHTRFYKKDLTLVQLENNAEVYLVNFSKLNRVLVVPADLRMEIDLSDAVVEQALKEEPIQETPEIGEILIGKPSDSNANKFHRGVVVEILPQKDKSPKIRVKFLDFGDEAVLELKDLKPVNQEIMEHPILGREVFLDGISEYNELILWSDFKTYMSRLKSVLKIQITDDADEEKPTVILSRVKKSKTQNKKTINKEILELGKWEWEKKFEDGCKDDAAMVFLKNQGKDLEILHSEMATPVLPLDIEMEMRVLICVDFKGLFCFPSDPRFHFTQDFWTLQAQIARYCFMVKASPFYATIQQINLLQIGGKWVRATRHDSELVMLIDEGTMLAFKPRVNAARPIIMDFARIPLFALQCELLGTSALSEEEKNCVREIFTKDSVHKFYIRSFNKEGGVYTVEYPDLMTKLAKKIGRK